MYCGDCGTKVPDDSDICPNCGRLVSPYSIKPDEEAATIPASPVELDNDLAPDSSFTAQEPVPVVIPPLIEEPAQAAAEPEKPQESKEQKPLRPNGIAVAALVCAIVGQICCCLPVPQFLLGIAGLVLGILGVRTKYKPMAVVSIILSIISILWSIVMAIIFVAASAEAATGYFSGKTPQEIFNEIQNII